MIGKVTDGGLVVLLVVLVVAVFGDGAAAETVAGEGSAGIGVTSEAPIGAAVKKAALEAFAQVEEVGKALEGGTLGSGILKGVSP